MYVFSAIIRPIPLPPRVKAFTKQDEDGTYNIYVNDLLSEEAAKEALEHEYDHIVNDDLIKEIPGHILK